MCGICGIVGSRVDDARLRAATDLLLHRGPDESGYYHDADVALGMRRLSIIDLAGGTQPKTDEQGLIQVVFNGEIYNYRELQQDLRARGHTFASDSDTEVIAHAYEEWGTDCFARLNGIFAVAIWDVRRQQLVLARDHLGVKPLYYAVMDGTILFGSELKPILALLPSVPAIDPDAALLYFRYQYVPAPRSIFAGIHKLPPAHVLIAPRVDGDVRIEPFWSPVQAAARKVQPVSAADAEDMVDEVITAAVRRQMVSDVPLGAFLSGGIDSSTVVALMQKSSGTTIRTFSIGFREASVDESVYAGEVARHLGTDHHSWIVTEDDALAVLPRLPHFFDEPFADSSAVPTFLVSELARRHVTVSLSGDGGDELFGGYERYSQLRALQHWWRMPAPLRGPALALAQRTPGSIGSTSRYGDSIFRAGSVADAYRNLVSVTRDGVLWQLFAREEARGANPEWPGHLFATHDLDEAMMLTDLATYLPDDILAKVDRASMAHSLEARVPLLDVRLVETALGLPLSVRMGGGPKALLKRVLKRYVPAELVDRPKHGFSIPIHDWLGGKLQSTLQEYTAPDLLREQGLLDEAVVSRLVREHVQGTARHGYTLWSILMFQLWYEHFYRQTGRMVWNEAVSTHLP